jgi:hypothetical protein
LIEAPAYSQVFVESCPTDTSWIWNILKEMKSLIHLSLPHPSSPPKVLKIGHKQHKQPTAGASDIGTDGKRWVKMNVRSLLLLELQRSCEVAESTSTNQTSKWSSCQILVYQGPFLSQNVVTAYPTVLSFLYLKSLSRLRPGHSIPLLSIKQLFIRSSRRRKVWKERSSKSVSGISFHTEAEV